MSCISPTVAMADRARLLPAADTARHEIAAVLAESRAATHASRRERREGVRARSGLEPWQWAEAHSPTQSVVVKRDVVNELGRKVVDKELCRRRLHDVHIWDRMSDEQIRAAECIVRGFELHGGRIGCSISRYDDQAPRSPISQPSAAAVNRDIGIGETYRRWCRACRDEVCQPGPVIDVLCQGMSLREFERAIRVRNGSGPDRLLAAVDVYISLGRRSNGRY